MKNFINHIFQIQFQQFLRLSFMVTCQSSELDWEVTVELPADFLSLGRGSDTEANLNPSSTPFLQNKKFSKRKGKKLKASKFQNCIKMK